MERRAGQVLRYEPYRLPLRDLGFDPFVPIDQEAEYLARHNIELQFLPNGALAAFAHLSVDDKPQANLSITFPTGSYQDPEGKTGLAHLVEHLFATDSVAIAKRNNANFNATTYPEKMQIDLSGLASTRVRDYGVWPVIPGIFAKIADPTGMSDPRFESEKQNIILEEMERQANWQFRAGKLTGLLLLDPNNPRAVGYIRDQGEVLNVTKDDVVEMIDRSLVPKDMVVTCYTYGDESLRRILKEEVVSRTLGLPREGIPSQRIDPILFGRINPDYKNGNIYAIDTGIDDGQMTITYHWLLPTPVYSRSIVAQQYILSSLEGRLFNFARAEGLSYSTAAQDGRFGNNLSVVSLFLQIPKRPTPESFARDLFKTLKDEVIAPVREDQPESLRIIKDQALIPFDQYSKFQRILASYQDYGRVIDFEKEEEWVAQTSLSDLSGELDRLMSTDPAIFLVGDIS